MRSNLELDPLLCRSPLAQCHANIRKDPTLKKATKKKPAKAKKWQPVKLTYEQRKTNLKAKLEALAEDD